MSFIYILLNLLLLSGLAAWYWQHVRRNEVLRKFFFPALLFKLCCGVLVGLVYLHYYNYGDSTQYQEGANILTAHAQDNLGSFFRILFQNRFPDEAFRQRLPYSQFPDFSNSFFMLKVLSVLNFLTGSSYYLNGLWLSFFSFCGCWFLVETLVRLLPSGRMAAVAAFLFFPSVIFWSSGVLKDSMGLGAIGLLVGSALRIICLKEQRWAGLLLGGWLLWRVKLFIAAAWFPLLLALAIVHKMGAMYPGAFKTFRRPVLFLLVLFLLGLGATNMHRKLRPDHLLPQILYGASLMPPPTDPALQVTFPGLEPTVESFAANAPKAFFSAMFRPFIWESKRPLARLAGAENLLLLLCTLAALASLFRRKWQPMHLVNLCFLVYAIITAVLIVYGAPNLGTLNRYRVLFLPFFLYVLLQAPVFRQVLQQLKQRLLANKLST